MRGLKHYQYDFKMNDQAKTNIRILAGRSEDKSRKSNTKIE